MCLTFYLSPLLGECEAAALTATALLILVTAGLGASLDALADALLAAGDAAVAVVLTRLAALSTGGLLQQPCQRVFRAAL
jgi:hypothetical protein